MGLKYIRNTDDATIVCRLASDKHRTFIFKPKKLDKRAGTVITNGFTEITDEDIALLREESSTFRFYESKNKLHVVSTLPLESMTSEQVIVVLRNEIADLKKQLKAKPDAGSEGADKTLVKELEALKAELSEKDEEIQRQQDIIEELQASLSAPEEAETPKEEKK